MALHRYGDFRVEVFYFDSPCTQVKLQLLPEINVL